MPEDRRQSTGVLLIALNIHVELTRLALHYLFIGRVDRCVALDRLAYRAAR